MTFVCSDCGATRIIRGDGEASLVEQLRAFMAGHKQCPSGVNVRLAIPAQEKAERAWLSDLDLPSAR